MVLTFQRPVGAKADLREIEYVSALHQTQPGAVRRDGSVTAVDIQLFLKSRYGLRVDLEDVKRTILSSFGGDQDDVIDLSELTAMLLIPTVIKAARCGRSNNNDEDDDDDDEHNDQKEERDYDQVLYPEPDLIQEVWSMIVRDVTGSADAPPKLTPSLLRDILLAYGEEELSNDMGLLQDMINAAGGGEEEVVFSVVAFSKALTADLDLYDVQSEARLTTNYHDVMSMEDTTTTTSKTGHLDLSSSEEEEEEADEENGTTATISGNNNKVTDEKPAVTFHRFRSTPAIDFTACRYSSKFIAVLLWTGFIISYIAYFALIIRQQTDWQFGSSKGETIGFGQRILYAILEWLFILATLCGFGLAYVALGSCGNGIDSTMATGKWGRLFAILIIGFFTWFFFFVLYNTKDEDVGQVWYYDENGELIRTEVIVDQKSEPYEAVVYFLSLIIGNVVILLELFLILGDALVYRCIGEASKRLILFFTSTGVKAEARSKHAAALKVNALVDNARAIHSYSSKDVDNGESSFGAGLLNFAVQGDKFEEAGGFMWTWKKIINNELFDHEGVWISARLLAGNFSQLLISAFIITYGIAFTRTAVAEWQKNKVDATRYLLLVLEWLNVPVNVQAFVNTSCAFFTNTTNADSSTCVTIAGEAINTTLQTISDSLYPKEQYMIELPMIIATAVAFGSCLALAATYIPSAATTTLQFRTGVIPLFGDKESFVEHRSRLDQITILLGSMFWSALYASGFVGILVGVVVFLFLWQATSLFFINLLAFVIAIISTIVIKILIAVLLLRFAYAGFYRKKVNQVNIVSLALECIMIGFAVGTALARAIKLVWISGLYIGRIDTPLLAPGVGVGPLKDRYPLIFRQDILALEAHRHPYLEQIGKMYLMKLRYGDRFANKAGYCYRLVFVVALMPWLRQYRVLARNEDSPDAVALRESTLLPRTSILARPASSRWLTEMIDTGVDLDEGQD